MDYLWLGKTCLPKSQMVIPFKLCVLILTIDECWIISTNRNFYYKAGELKINTGGIIISFGDLARVQLEEIVCKYYIFYFYIQPLPNL